MSDEILQSIFEFTKKFNDPENNQPFDQKNSKIQIIEKNGNVNITLNINNEYLDQYRKLADLFKLNLSKISGILSINVALTSENQATQSKKNESITFIKCYCNFGFHLTYEPNFCLIISLSLKLSPQEFTIITSDDFSLGANLIASAKA